MCFTSSTSPPPAVRGARTDVAGAPGSVLAGRHASARLCGRLSHGELARAGVKRAKTVEAADLHASSWKAGTSTTMRRPLHPTIALPCELFYSRRLLAITSASCCLLVEHCISISSTASAGSMKQVEFFQRFSDVDARSGDEASSPVPFRIHGFSKVCMLATCNTWNHILFQVAGQQPHQPGAARRGDPPDGLRLRHRSSGREGQGQGPPPEAPRWHVLLLRPRRHRRSHRPAHLQQTHLRKSSCGDRNHRPCALDSPVPPANTV